MTVLDIIFSHTSTILLIHLEYRHLEPIKGNKGILAGDASGGFSLFLISGDLL